MITLTALVGRRPRERAGDCTSGPRSATACPRDEIQEVLLQSAIYCSVPSANRAFAIAQQTLQDDGLL